MKFIKKGTRIVNYRYGRRKVNEGIAEVSAILINRIITL